ncbi:hypothetical protein HYALB_00011383 [Hymenoscyphus albidus]|uniref:Alpha/beta hydrolase fold-3 domain-containing protein n=1 Tax=Hymenoscyphus albidus TaxID=595503 RepID=A0A9N9Q2D9_9HELO|nr:hypothetical protein HYALB_00011383 [Hymenoscyphus albidus]
MVFNFIEGTRLVVPAGRAVVATLKGKNQPQDPSEEEAGHVELLDLMRHLLAFTFATTIEDLHALTNISTPAPSSVLITDVTIPSKFYDEAAVHIRNTLGETNLNLVGKTWWQWRREGSAGVLKTEWIEMRADFLERGGERAGGWGKKVMFYIHGGGYHLGGVGHGPQCQRHARKLKGRVFAPRYRLAPSFPFPCALQDLLAAYLYLLTIQDPSTIVFAGDSAGGGLCLALLMILRDQGLALPAGASLISPWVDLTHSFPSILIPTDQDYVPAFGFHAKPSLAWPPPNSDEMKTLKWPRHKGALPDYEMEIDGETVVLKEQIQMYAENNHVTIPLVSPVLAASLGGLCPLQVIVGGSELLRDEQIYLAHKAANPEEYRPNDKTLAGNGDTVKDILRYPPTNVQLLVFDGAPHAAPTLGHTNVAKYQYRAVAQFSAWALAQAQRADIDLQDDSSIHAPEVEEPGQIGKVGDRLPSFKEHMTRHRVSRSGHLFPLPPASELPACVFPVEEIGWPKAEAVKEWIRYRETVTNVKFASQRQKVMKQRVQNAQIGYIQFPNGEVPPPTALAGRRVIGQELKKEGRKSVVGTKIMSRLSGRYDDDAPLGDGPEGSVIKRDRRRTVTYHPQEEGITTSSAQGLSSNPVK